MEINFKRETNATNEANFDIPNAIEVKNIPVSNYGLPSVANVHRESNLEQKPYLASVEYEGLSVQIQNRSRFS